MQIDALYQAHDCISEQELERYTHALPVDASTEQAAVRTEMNHCVQEFIRKLPGDYSTVLVLSRCGCGFGKDKSTLPTDNT